MLSLHSIPKEQTDIIPDYVKVAIRLFRRSFKREKGYRLAWDGTELWFKNSFSTSWERMGPGCGEYTGVGGWLDEYDGDDRRLAYSPKYSEDLLDHIGPMGPIVLRAL